MTRSAHAAKFETRTGGATRSSVQRDFDGHRFEAQAARERLARGRRVISIGVGRRAGQRGVETFPAAESTSAYSMVLWDGSDEEECYLASYLRPVDGDTEDANWLAAK